MSLFFKASNNPSTICFGLETKQNAFKTKRHAKTHAGQRIDAAVLMRLLARHPDPMQVLSDDDRRSWLQHHSAMWE